MATFSSNQIETTTMSSPVMNAARLEKPTCHRMQAPRSVTNLHRRPRVFGGDNSTGNGYAYTPACLTSFRAKLTQPTITTVSVLRPTRSRSASSAGRPRKNAARPPGARIGPVWPRGARLAGFAERGFCLFGQTVEWPYGYFDDRSGSEKLTQ